MSRVVLRLSLARSGLMLFRVRRERRQHDTTSRMCMMRRPPPFEHI